MSRKDVREMTDSQLVGELAHLESLEAETRIRVREVRAEQRVRLSRVLAIGDWWSDGKYSTAHSLKVVNPDRPDEGIGFCGTRATFGIPVDAPSGERWSRHCGRCLNSKARKAATHA